MADVSVNIRGRDDGLGSTLDELREKVRQLGQESDNLNDKEFDSGPKTGFIGGRGSSYNPALGVREIVDDEELTPTEKKRELSRRGDKIVDDEQEKIRQEFQDARMANLDEFNEMQDKYDSGEVSKKEFEDYALAFQQNSKELNKEEERELLEVEKEMAQTLREIHRELADEKRIEKERAQMDTTEHATGVQGSIMAENRELRRLQSETDDEEEVAQYQSQIDANNARLKELRRPKDEDEDEGIGGPDFRGLMMTAGSAGRGDLMGTIQGGSQGMGQLTGMVQGFTIAGLAAMIIKETLGHGDKLREAVAPVAAMRGEGVASGAVSNDYIRDGFNDRFDFGALGLDNVEAAGMMRQKALSSGMAGNDLQERTYEDVSFQKAFGADASQFSQFERFTKGQEDASEIAMDVLNVLTSIEKSSLKETDLSTLTEKLSAQNTILSLQRQRRDVVDSDGALQVMAAFESIGLSGKGERAGDFLANTIQGLGEGGSDNVMMLKLEAAKRANPELADDPAALRRAVKFNPDDPEYMAEVFKMLGDMTGDNEMAQDDAINAFFNPQSEADMDMYKKAMKDGNFQDIIRGKGMEEMKERKSTLDESTMTRDAESGIGGVTELLKDFSNRSQNVADLIATAFKAITQGTDAVNVNVLRAPNNTPPASRNTNVPGNTYNTGN